MKQQLHFSLVLIPPHWAASTAAAAAIAKAAKHGRVGWSTVSLHPYTNSLTVKGVRQGAKGGQWSHSVWTNENKSDLDKLQSRLASVDLDLVLGPSRLALHT